VASVREVPLNVSVTVTMTPAMTPPVWSVTVPEIVPALPCAYALVNVDKSNAHKNKNANNRFMD
jgi:hypothetical protein